MFVLVQHHNRCRPEDITSLESFFEWIRSYCSISTGSCNHRRGTNSSTTTFPISKASRIIRCRMRTHSSRNKIAKSSTGSSIGLLFILSYVVVTIIIISSIITDTTTTTSCAITSPLHKGITFFVTAASPVCSTSFSSSSFGYNSNTKKKKISTTTTTTSKANFLLFRKHYPFVSKRGDATAFAFFHSNNKQYNNNNSDSQVLNSKSKSKNNKNKSNHPYYYKSRQYQSLTTTTTTTAKRMSESSSALSSLQSTSLSEENLFMTTTTSTTTTNAVRGGEIDTTNNFINDDDNNNNNNNNNNNDTVLAKPTLLTDNDVGSSVSISQSLLKQQQQQEKCIPNWRTVPKSLFCSTVTEPTNDPSSTNDNQTLTATTTSTATATAATTTDSNIRTIWEIVNEREQWSDSVYKHYLQLYNDFISCEDSYVSGHIQAAIQTIHHAFRLYGGVDSVLCSFNGGKDAVVVLEIFLAAAAKYYYDTTTTTTTTNNNNNNNSNSNHNEMTTTRTTITSSRNRPRVVYFEHADEFSEIITFVKDTVRTADLDMISFEEGIKFQNGLRLLVDHNIPSSIIQQLRQYDSDDNRNKTRIISLLSEQDTNRISWPLAFVLGTRSGDPNAGGQEQFAPSSASYMPPFMRVNPILSWTYGHVWHFLRLFQLPYCSLYDQGYTSLGTVKDTIPCPALAVPGRTNETTKTTSIPRYWPAYMLQDWDQERAGRISKTIKASSSNNHGIQKRNMNKTTIQQKKKGTQSTTATSTATTAEVGTTAQVVLQAKEMLADPTEYSSVSSSTGGFSAMTLGRFPPEQPAPIPSPAVDIDTFQPRTDADVGIPSVSSRNTIVDENKDETDEVVSYSKDERTKSVGVMIIGDEILKGYTVDVNTHAAAQAFREKGVLLQRVVIVSDDIDEISNEIVALLQQVDVIITSGGVGPTHDDVTIKGVAAALNCDIVLHEEMADLLREKMNPKTKKVATQSPVAGNSDNDNSKEDDDDDKIIPELTEAQKKMAMLPSSSKLRYLSNNPNDWPVLQCKNVFILPGVPQYFAQKIGTIAEYLSCQLLERTCAYKVILSVEESTIVPILNQVVVQHPGVSIGSYPFISHPDFKTVLTVEGKFGCIVNNQRAGIATRNNNNTSISFDSSTINSNDEHDDGDDNNNNNSTDDGNGNIIASTSFTNNYENADNDNESDKSKTTLAEQPPKLPAQRSDDNNDVNRMVQLALDDLITALPPNSVLRVENNDDMTLF